MDMQIEGLRVLVTAGAGGIGLEVARAFTREGAKVYVCDVDEAALAALKVSDPKVKGVTCDVAERAAVARMFEDAVSYLGGLDVLVNNAGIAGPTARVEDVSFEDWDRCIEICLTSQFTCARLAVKHLKESPNASIINLSSAAGKHGFALRSPYAAAKWGVIGFTKSLAIELGPFGIRVNAILPGLVKGDRIRRVLEAKTQQYGESFAAVEQRAFAATSIKEYILPQELADQMVFIASPRGRTISGQAISIDGDTKMLM
ncbi:MAG: SDR family oxidoreductase [Methylocystis sp.]|nr:SDR family oxidoreductase [Methylocystis sp.]MCA3582306.1 SDR family oxidoreductase [Methylocystis sp.]MCA3588201.1 SDR family oxidoreductase [Methylocystis sp.]MCA3590119.1 SDR family oxidoreductase [Methylocystis sp.]